jgi:fermentation-respiration switch protein FrsA (DUF1100 family)
VIYWILGIAAALYLLVAAGLYVFQRQLLYVPDKTRPDFKEVETASAREVTLTTADGLQLLAWYVPPPAGAPVVVYYHGNGGHLGYRHHRLDIFAAAGFGVLFPEYRGYGGNPGRPTEAGLYIDARAALDFLAAHGIAPARVVLYGESLGTGVAVRMASERPVGAVVLEAPYSSIADAAQYHYPFVPARLLLRDRFDSMAYIGAVRAPLFVMLGGRDVIVPTRLGRALYDAAPEPKELWVAPEGGHEDLPEFGALDAARDFIRRRVPNQG